MKKFLMLILFASCLVFAQQKKELPITIESGDSLGTTIDQDYGIAGFVIPDTSLIDGSSLYFQEYSEGQWIDTYNYEGDRLAVTVGRGRSIKLPFIDFLNFESRWRAVASEEQDTTVTFKVLLIK